MSKRIILVGCAASGKDHLRKKFESRGFKYATSYTTRPPREGEENGKDYNFISEELFKKKISLGFWYEYVEFNGWFYGTSKRQFDHDDLFIMTPKGLSHLSEKDRKESFVIFLDIPEEIRRKRLSERQDKSDKIERRIIADNKDFEGFNDYDMRITESTF